MEPELNLWHDDDRILSQAETAGPNPGTTVYTYDALYRLTRADYPGSANDEIFSYDPVGNRKTHTQGSLAPNATTRHYTYLSGSNRLESIRIGSTSGSVHESYQYDANGNLTQISGHRSLSLTWDANNRPSSIDGTRYQYDPLGYRIDKNGSQIRHYYLEGEHLEAIYDGNGALYAHYIRGSVIDEIVNGYQRDTNNKLINTSYHHDALQSVLGQSGHEGTILATQTYGAFGNILNATGTSNNMLKYTGRENDSTGLYYYRARYYDPIIGRFLSEDPLGFDAGDVNFYAYVGNNPVNANDPTGMVKIPGVGAVTEALAKLATEKHHTVPVEILKSLPPEVANNPLVRDIAGAPNKWAIPQDVHRQIHQGAGGGLYNEAWKAEITQVKKEFGTITVDNVVRIRNDLTQQFGLAQYRPGASAGTLNELGSVLATGAIIGLNVLDAAGQILSPVTTYLLGNETGRSSDIVPRLNGSSSATWWPGSATRAWNQSTANGGFVLYPNKANTNMMQSVYSK